MGASFSSLVNTPALQSVSRLPKRFRSPSSRTRSSSSSSIQSRSEKSKYIYKSDSLSNHQHSVVSEETTPRWSLSPAPVAESEAGSDETATSSSSMPQRIDKFRRKYHNVEDSPYPLPGDIEEGNRLNLQHYLMKNLFGGNFHSVHLTEKLRKGIKVLDVGAGSGVWTFEMARDFPNSDFYAVDIAISEWSRKATELTNVQFLFGNILESLPFEDNTFDYVFERGIGVGVPSGRWLQITSELMRVTKPGGWVELIEGDALMHGAGPKMDVLWNQLCYRALTARGIDIRSASRIGEHLANVGMQDVKAGYISFPIGWGGAAGKYWAQDFHAALINSKGFASSIHSMDELEYDALIDAAMHEPENTQKYKPWANAFWAFGRKPF